MPRKNALLNYTTEVTADKSVSQIMAILIAHGARSIMSQYDNGKVVAIAFQIQTREGLLRIRLPAKPDVVRDVLWRQYQESKIRRTYTSPEHAERVAWRIVKDWVEAQMAILDTEQVRMEEIFLAYIMNAEGKTLFETLLESKLLPVGRTE